MLRTPAACEYMMMESHTRYNAFDTPVEYNSRLLASVGDRDRGDITNRKMTAKAKGEGIKYRCLGQRGSIQLIAPWI